MVERTGALGYFGDARRAALGTELIERVTATGSLVIRKLGETRAGELAIHRFLSAPSVSCQEMLGTLAGRSLTAAAGRRIVVAQDTTEINFAGREANRRGLGPAGDGVSAGFFIHPLVASIVRRRLFSVFWTRISGPATTRSRQHHGASVRLKTRKAFAGYEAPSKPQTCWRMRRRRWWSAIARTTSTVALPAVRQRSISSFERRKTVLWSTTHCCSPARWTGPN